MRELIKTGKSFIKHPNVAVQNIIEKENTKLGVVIGLIGVCSFEISSSIARIIQGSFNSQNIFQSAGMTLFKVIIYFMIHVGVTFFIGKAFKGEGNIINYSGHIGWSFLPAITISLTLIPIIAGSKLSKIFPDLVMLINFIVIICVFLIIAQVVWSFRISISIFSNSMKLSKNKSIAIYFITLIPLFILFDSFF